MDHILLFQYGDYGAAWRGLAAGAPETYRDQKASVDFVAHLAGRFRVTTLSICDRPHREELSPGLWSIGISFRDAYRARKILPLLQQIAPDRLILRTPHRHALLWAKWRGLPTLPVFADTFTADSLRQRLENRFYHWMLASPHVPCIANHSLNASRSLCHHLGLAPELVVPWDNPLPTCDAAPRAPAPTNRPLRAFYAGLIIETKGIGDCLQAAALLAARGEALEIDFAGDGDLEDWRARAARLGLADRVRFLGARPNAEVRARMRQADLVLVPSRHDYAEGLPNTLIEALAVRSPVIVSDHPAFASRLQKDRDSLIFAAAQPEALAREIQRLRHDPDLQRRLSDNAAQTLNSLRFGMDWFDLMRSFIDDPTGSSGWIARNSLTAQTHQIRT